MADMAQGAPGWSSSQYAANEHNPARGRKRRDIVSSMRRTRFARALIPFFTLPPIGCAPADNTRPPGAPSDEETVSVEKLTQAVARELDDLHDAAARADEARYFAHFAPNAVFLGTDATERWNMAAFRAFAHPHFAAGRGWTYKSVRRAIAFADNGMVAYFDEDLENARIGPTRGSGVLVREKDRYLLVQYNLALTIPNESVPAVRAVIAERDGGGNDR
jgi:hypothetical protein